MNLGVLYIVATPIGNLKDVTYRAVETLKEVGLIACEDTRDSRKFLDHYQISTPTMSFYQNLRSGRSTKPVPKSDLILAELKNGKNVAFITDAGTPGISDPGNQLVEKAAQENIKIVPIPGASSLTTLISVSGIDMQKFVFLGFPPHKKGRETFFKNLLSYDMPVAYFESPHRVIKNLELLKSLDSNKKVILGRELTKMFEEIVRGSAEEILQYFAENKDKVKGEFVIIVY